MCQVFFSNGFEVVLGCRSTLGLSSVELSGGFGFGVVLGRPSAPELSPVELGGGFVLVFGWSWGVQVHSN